MKLITIVTAYAALGELSNIKLDAQTAYNVYEMKRNLREQVAYFTTEEMKLIDTYAARRADGQPDIRDGLVYFSGDTDEERAANARAYNTERAKLCSVDTRCIYDDRLAELRVPGNIRISPTVFEALESFAKVTIDAPEISAS